MLLGPLRTLSVSCVGLALVLMVAGCASQRPVLYPNAKLQRVGNEVAQRDIDECMRLAEDYGVSHGGGEQAARRAGEGAAVGGAAVRPPVRSVDAMSEILPRAARRSAGPPVLRAARRVRTGQAGLTADSCSAACASAATM